MATKYLDNDGLLYFWQQLKTLFADKVDKVSGKGLSTNDYTTAEKTKLDGIAAGAEVNVQPDWNEADSDADDYIKNKPSIPVATSTTPKVNGTAAVGSETKWAKGDHVHPTDTTRQAKITASGLLKGDGVGGVTAAVAGTDYIASHQDISGKLDKSGGTMTGKLTLDGAPTSNLHAATKKYVDDSIPTVPVATTTTPKANGTAAVGSETKWAKGDHVHPTDTTRAPLASPTFTGTPAAPTAASGTNTTQIATTAFVQSEINAAVSGSAMFQGELAAQSTLTNASYKKGWYWVVSTAGTYAGEVCEVGDMVYAVKDKSSAYAASDFVAIQRNLDLASITNAEIDTIMAS